MVTVFTILVNLENCDRASDHVKDVLSIRSPMLITKFTGKHLCQSLFLIKLQASACNFSKKEALAQVFSCEFYEISKNTFLHRTSLVAASMLLHMNVFIYLVQYPLSVYMFTSV